MAAIIAYILTGIIAGVTITLFVLSVIQICRMPLPQAPRPFHFMRFPNGDEIPMSDAVKYVRLVNPVVVPDEAYQPSPDEDE